MSRKRKLAIDDRSKPRPKSTSTPGGSFFPGRDGLLAYIQEPESFPPSRVIYYNEDWVLINDLYPKSSVHMLLLPRHPSIYTSHPFDAFTNTEFLAFTQAELLKAREIAVSELRRLHGSFSATEKTRLEAMESDDPPTTLPSGRDWASSILIGVHANPSMNHLHIHIISEDRHGECLKHKKHYNSFTTPFFVRLHEMPLERDDERWYGGAGPYLDAEMMCWRCGTNFGNRFARLKEHLDVEFEEWRRE